MTRKITIGLMLGILAGELGAQNLNSGLVSYWKEDASGSHSDSVGGNTGTVTGAVSYTASGKLGGAYSYNAAGSQSDGLVSAAVTGLSSWTSGSMSAWIKVTVYSSGNKLTVMQIPENGGYGHLWLSIIPGTRKVQFVAGTGTADAGLDGTTALADNTWYHVVAVWNKTAKTTSLYVNGQLEGTRSIPNFGAQESRLVWGAGYNGFGTRGTIDEVGLWNRVLTAGEVASLYNGGAGQAYPFSAASTGTIQVSSNLGNATWGIGGTASYNGTGNQTVNGAAAGSYTMTWGAVAGYQTPSQQTLNLTAGSTIQFNGNYVPLTICTPPVITNLSPSVSIATGGSTTLSVGASGTLPLSYQWYRGNSGDTSQPLGGATGASYSTGALSATTRYWVRVTGCQGNSANSGTVIVTVQGGCTYGLQPEDASFGQAGGTGSFQVVTGAGCAWTAGSDANWMRVTGAASGSGNGTVSYTVDVNGSGSQRLGSFTGLGGLSFVVRQSGATTLPAVELLTPTNGVAGRLPETFSWKAASGASRYVLQVAPSAGFASAQGFYTNRTSLLVPDNVRVLSQAQDVYWRVGALTGLGESPSVWSEVRRYRLGGTVTAPGAPNRVRPADGNTLAESPVTFEWSAVSGATKYQLEYATRADFGNSVRLSDTGNTQVGVALPFGNYTVYWRVRAGNSAGYGAYSSTGNFRMANELPVSSVTLSGITSPVQRRSRVTVTATLTGRHTGAVTGYWMLDGGTRQDFQIAAMGAGTNKVTMPVVTDPAGEHSVQVFLTAPNQVQSGLVKYRAEDLAGPFSKIRLWVERPTMYLGQQTVIHAELQDAQGRTVLNDARQVVFQVVDGVGIGQLTAAPGVTVNLGETVTGLRATGASGVVTVQASSGTVKEVVKVAVGAEKMRDLALEYVKALEQLKLPPLEKVFNSAPPSLRNYSMSSCRSTIQALNLSSPGDVDLLERLLLGLMVLHRVWGKGMDPIGSDTMQFGAAQLAVDQATGIAEILMWLVPLDEVSRSLRKLSQEDGNAAKKAILRWMTSETQELQDKIVDYVLHGVCVGIGWAGLDTSRCETIILGARGLATRRNGSWSVEAATSVIGGVVQYVASESIAATYLGSTQTQFDRYVAAARNKTGPFPGLDGVHFTADFQTQLAGKNASAAHEAVEYQLKWGGTFALISDVSNEFAKAPGIGPLAQVVTIAGRILTSYEYILAIRTAIIGLESVQTAVPMSLHSALPGAGISTSASRKPVEQDREAAEERTASVLRQPVMQDLMTTAAAFSVLAAKSMAAVEASDWSSLRQSLDQMHELGAAMDAEQTLLSGSLNAYMPGSGIVTSGFAEWNEQLTAKQLAWASRRLEMMTVMEAVYESTTAQNKQSAAAAVEAALNALAAYLEAAEKTATAVLLDTAGPGLTVTGIVTPGEAVARAPFAIRGTVVNTGGAAAAETAVELSLPAEFMVTNARQAVGALGAGASVELTWQVIWTGGGSADFGYGSMMPSSTSSPVVVLPSAFSFPLLRFTLSQGAVQAGLNGGGGTVRLSVTPAGTVPVSTSAGWITAQLNGDVLTYSIAANAGGIRTGTITVGDQTIAVTQAGSGGTPPPVGGLVFVPLAPCRVMETRAQYNFEGRVGAFGPPSLTSGETRTMNLPGSNVCAIPATAKAYVLNVTLIPSAGVNFATVWAAGEARPNVWTVRSLDAQVVANTAIVKAGANGGVSVYVSDATDMLMDISGYYTDPAYAANGLVYYPMTPCRVVDTRALYRPVAGEFGPPSLTARTMRKFRMPATPYCQVPVAAAYSVTVTVAPPAGLPYLTMWPDGQGQPNVSSINSF
ncbi:MAG: hypothetical protein JST93_01605, partial [Acidobacteria bacterium]|nr:hypothetical protein [Acidobacteriota bacterium]